jgi:hypothetical protein
MVAFGLLLFASQFVAYWLMWHEAGDRPYTSGNSVYWLLIAWVAFVWVMMTVIGIAVSESDNSLASRSQQATGSSRSQGDAGACRSQFAVRTARQRSGR